MSVGDVWFAHGKESGPWGAKITALAAAARRRGWRVTSLDFTHSYDPHRRIARLIDCLNVSARRPLVLVGSSMGAYVVLKASERVPVDGLFVMAPAVDLPGYEGLPGDRGVPLTVVHGWRDHIVPVDRAWRLAADRRADLHVRDSGHDLGDQLAFLGDCFTDFLQSVTETVDGM